MNRISLRVHFLTPVPKTQASQDIDIPGPKLPTVGSRYWDWETTVGLDPLGTENYSEPDCVVEDIILTLNK